MELASAVTRDTLRSRVEHLNARLRAKPDPALSAATTETQWREPEAWYLSAASPITQHEAHPCHNAASAKLALTEIRTAREILGLRALLKEPGHQDYLDALDAGLRQYDNSHPQVDREMNLAVALATARTNLMDRASKLPIWIAILRAAGGPADCKPPARFVSSPSPLVGEEISEQMLRDWNDLHALQSD